MLDVHNDNRIDARARRLRPLFSRRAMRRIVKAGLAALIGATVTMASLGMSPARAYAAVPEVRTPLRSGVEVPTPLAVFGSAMVFGTHRSTNGGATWTTDQALSGINWTSVGNGTLTGYVTSPSGSVNAEVYTPATGKVTTFALPSFPQGLTDTWALMPGWPSPSAYNLLTGESAPIADPPAGPESQYAWPQLLPSGGILWTGMTDTYQSAYAVSSSPSAAPGPWVTIGDFGSMVTPTQLLYAHQNGTSVELCARPLTNLSASPTCSVILTGIAANMSSVQLFGFGSTTIADVTASVGPTSTIERTVLWNGSTAKRMVLPQGSTLSQPAAPSYLTRAYGDTPYLVLRDANTVPYVMRVAANGTLQRGFTLPRTSAAPLSFLAAAPDRLVGGDTRDGSTYLTPAWVRTVSGSGFGRETQLPARASWVSASAGRTAVSGVSGLTLYDKGVVASTQADARLVDLSGPYISRIGYSATVDSSQVEISTVDGAAVATFLGTSGALFGSEYVTWAVGSPTTVTINDLTGATPPKTVQLSGDTASCYGGHVWGDRLYLSCAGRPTVFSLVDGSVLASLDTPGSYSSVITAGDGYAVVTSDSVTYSLWNVATGTLLPLTGCTYRIATDGVGHVACSTATELVWRDFSALSTSAPRLLGTVAPATMSFAATPTWSLALDTTKALSAGAVVISTAAGAQVRSLPVAPMADGSVRVTWDGLDATGKPVPTGTYTYTLVASGADGSGSVVRITGTGQVSGTVAVTTPACQGRPGPHGCHR